MFGGYIACSSNLAGAEYGKSCKKAGAILFVCFSCQSDVFGVFPLYGFSRSAKGFFMDELFQPLSGVLVNG